MTPSRKDSADEASESMYLLSLTLSGSERVPYQPSRPAAMI